MFGREVRAKDTYLRGHGVHHPSLEYPCLPATGNSVATEDTREKVVKNRRQCSFQKEDVCVSDTMEKSLSCDTGVTLDF